MAVQLTCDLCLKDVERLDQIGTLNAEYQIGSRIVHICAKCSKRVNKRLQLLTNYYSREIANDMRHWLLDINSASQEKVAKTQ